MLKLPQPCVGLLKNKSRKMKIYTKTGDKGETSLFGGSRLPKSHLRIEAYGNVDELNAHIGLLRDLATHNSDLQADLKHIQDCLFIVGANLAADEKADKKYVPDLLDTDISVLEQRIDKMETELPTLKNFILPGGHTTVSHCHLARCVCRRAERGMVALSLVDAVNPILIQYTNRLSDYLFVLARHWGQTLNAPEIAWKPRG
jgi:cob(I)alamin adenosyltransferase